MDVGPVFRADPLQGTRVQSVRQRRPVDARDGTRARRAGRRTGRPARAGAGWSR